MAGTGSNQQASAPVGSQPLRLPDLRHDNSPPIAGAAPCPNDRSNRIPIGAAYELKKWCPDLQYPGDQPGGFLATRKPVWISTLHFCDDLTQSAGAANKGLVAAGRAKIDALPGCPG